MAQDPYTELGVPRTASPDDIRRAFRKLAKQYHPDQNPDDKGAEERFKRVSGAFDILGDPEKKARFDRGEIDADGNEAARGYAGAGAGGAGGFGGRPSGYEYAGGGPGGGFSARFEGADLEDILGDVLGRGGPGAGMGGGFGGTGRPFSGRGADVRARLEIDLEDAIKGVTRRVSFGDRTIEVTIPKGAAEGQTLRLRGQGQPGRSSGGPGDALIELAIKPHPIYRVEGADLHMDLPVGVPDAVLGAKIQAPTPDGEVTLTVPKRSSSGAVLRLKGRGAVEAETGRRGDLFARLMIALPEDADPALERFAETWRKDRPYTPRRR